LSRSGSSGKRLFGDIGDKKSLQLSASQTVGEGISILTFKSAK
jgi:hypothetical protein